MFIQSRNIFVTVEAFKKQVLILGGHGNSMKYEEVELFDGQMSFPFGKLASGPNLGQCAVNIDDRNFFISGGYENEEMEWTAEIYTLEEDKIKLRFSLKLPRPRYYHICGLVTHSGKE